MAKKSKKNDVLKGVFKAVLVLGLVAGLAAAVAFAATDFLKTSRIFTIRAVILDPSLQPVKSRYLEGLIGKNIFDVDLRAVQRKVQLQYPEIHNLRILRRLPDKIHVTAQRREPFAGVRFHNREVILDRNGTVVSLSPIPSLRLPAITGARISQPVAVGKPVNEKTIGAALSVLKAVQTNSDLSAMSVVSIDVANLSNIEFHTSDGLKVIIDDEDIYPKIRKLGILTTQGDVNLKDYKYVDLRFQQPVLGKN
ncbi:MAG: cell division protein FtsQ/DivIB [Candidatus Omnitrophota bacterium]|nr:cell division protein FtsQ/DivIB [Candidatus Omnitrophota bacterium]MDZ4242362.1 cell division protein FtsQ/DivIB [Candidatus Omnitrophota bacterium]